MKAKLKNGEVIKIADYHRIVLDSCDSWGNPIEVEWEDVKEILDDDDFPIGLPKKVAGAIIMPNVDWEKVRIDAAIAIESSMLINNRNQQSENIAKRAVAYADALIEELKELRKK